MRQVNAKHSEYMVGWRGMTPIIYHIFPVSSVFCKNPLKLQCRESIYSTYIHTSEYGHGHS
jgi:hypothetical protein